MSERLQKLLAGAGHGSRRGIEEWIREGRVTINGRVAGLGDRASHEDLICLDGRALELGGAQSTEVLLYHKPLGEVTTRSDPEGRMAAALVNLAEAHAIPVVEPFSIRNVMT